MDNNPPPSDFWIPYPEDYEDDDWDAELEYDMDARPQICETCGGEIGASYSTCTCEDDDQPLSPPTGF